MFNEPFVKDSELERLVKVETGYLPTEREKAEKLYQWMREHIAYDSEKYEKILQGINGHYRNSLETFHDKKGVCGEQAFLYVTLARILGLSAGFVQVEENGKDLHACAAVHLDDTYVYVDTTSCKGFGIRHKRVTMMSDEETRQLYFSYNRNARRVAARREIEVVPASCFYGACFVIGALLCYIFTS